MRKSTKPPQLGWSLYVLRFENGDLIPNEELDIYPQTQEVILASLSPDIAEEVSAETKRLKSKPNEN